MREAGQFARGGRIVQPSERSVSPLGVAAPTALLIGKSVRDVLPHSLGYWNDSAQKSAGDGNGCG